MNLSDDAGPVKGNMADGDPGQGNGDVPPPPDGGGAGQGAPRGPSIGIIDEMRQSYVDYAMSVITDRALPDVRDGLKPVHRRILHVMNESGYGSRQPFRKSARIVGDVMGKYHPHGDSAIYDAMARLVQPFSMRVPLIQGQGNFGSIDGDNPAAMRYTEARLSKLTEELLLADTSHDTVDLTRNYDDSLDEPTVLPSRIPNLLVNGSSGIAVGMATNIPPHNPVAALSAAKLLLDNPDCGDDALIDVIQGPDFPTGGLIVGRSGLYSMYKTGSGSIVMRGRVEIEDRGRQSAIIINEIPYMVNKAGLVAEIADKVNQKLIEGISDLRDESDRAGIRVVISLKRDAQPEVVLNQLYRQTALQTSFPSNIRALVNGRPEQLSLRRILGLFLTFREDVISRRTIHELRDLRTRSNVLSGLLLAHSDIDRVIATIRAAADRDAARVALAALSFQSSGDLGDFLARFDGRAADDVRYLNPVQIQAILEMRLSGLVGLERRKLMEEAEQALERMRALAAILNDRQVLLSVVRTEIDEAIALLGEHASRRSEIVEDAGDLTNADLIPVEDMVVTVTRGGYIRRVKLAEFRTQHRGGKGKSGVTMHDDDAVSGLYTASSHAAMLFFATSEQGIRVFRKWVYELPEAGVHGRGKALVNVFPVERDETIVATVLLPPELAGAGLGADAVENEDAVTDDAEETGEAAETGEPSILLATAHGTIRRNPVSVFAKVRSTGKNAMKFKDSGNRLIGAVLARPDQDVMLVSDNGKAIRFPVTDVSLINSCSGMGVRGMKLGEGDAVVSMTALESGDFSIAERNAYLRMDGCEEQSDGEQTAVLDAQTLERMREVDQTLLMVTSGGYAKRSPAFCYRQQGRGGTGVAAIGESAKRGKLVSCFPVDPGDQILAVTGNGQMIRTEADAVRKAGRASKGVILFNIGKNEIIASVCRIIRSAEGEPGGENVAAPVAEGGVR